MGRIIISKVNNHNLLFLFNDEHELSTISCIRSTLVDAVFVGKIVEINEGLNACFVSISKEQKVFLSLNEFKSKPKCGDELVVQIKTEALKTKLPQATTCITLPGQYCVCHLDGTGVSISKKLENSKKEYLKNYVDSLDIAGLRSYRWVIRTNTAALIPDSLNLLDEELKRFTAIADFISSKAQHRTIYTTLYEASSELLRIISNIPLKDYSRIITDNRSFYEELLGSKTLLKDKDIVLYDDEYISLNNLHSLETYLNRALDKKVYLDCGGYLVIEPTEAMTVIDINSGKAEGKRKDNESFFFKINKQAAVEVARQLRLRNISGIIIVDFVNMKSKDNERKLTELLRAELNKDRIKTTLVDMTALGLAEITRKKVSNPLDKEMSQ